MPQDQVYCPKCGSANSGTGAFCQKCGALMMAGQPAISVPVPSPSAAFQPAMAGQVAATVVNYVPAVSLPYAGFWIRLLAYLIDRTIISLVAVPLFIVLILPSVIRVVHVARQNQEPTPELIAALVSTVFGFVLIAMVGQWLYEALLTSSSWQGTIGKKVLSLKVTDESGNRISFARATGRFFGKVLSHLMLHIGFIMAAFTQRKQALHDMIAGTLVLRK
jgi:uncharacterized RDD family membrane protein YckC